MIIFVGNDVRIDFNKLDQEWRGYCRRQRITNRSRGKVKSIGRSFSNHIMVEVVVDFPTRNKLNQKRMYFSKKIINSGALIVIPKKRSHPLTDIFK